MSGSADLSGPVLAFDASTFAAAAALLGPDGSEWGGWVQPEGQRGTSQLAPAVAALLAGKQLAVADLAGVVVGIGPGSYTGLRSAIAFARALCWPSKRPLVGLPSVASAAAALLDARPQLRAVITVVDARRGECYRADYARCDNSGAGEKRVGVGARVGAGERRAGAGERSAVAGAAVAMIETLAPCLVPSAQIDALEPSDDVVVLREPAPSAVSLARLALARLADGGDDPATVLPLYLKRSHAEIALEERGG